MYPERAEPIENPFGRLTHRPNPRKHVGLLDGIKVGWIH